jgi:hypothetical protein
MDGEFLTPIQRHLTRMNRFVEISLRVADLLTHQDVLNVRLTINESPGVDLRTACDEVGRHFTWCKYGRRRCHYFAPVRFGGSVWGGGVLQGICDTPSAYDPVLFSIVVLTRWTTLTFSSSGVKVTSQAIKTTEIHKVNLQHTESTSGQIGSHCRIVLRGYFCARFLRYLMKWVCLTCPGRLAPAYW